MKEKKVLSILFFAIIVFCIWSFTKPKQDKTDFSERAKIILREVGNQLLLSHKDSVSLILPIVKIDDFKYQISFEKSISFEPNTLVNIIKEVFEKTNFHENYRVEVFGISSKEVAYSYEISVAEERTIIPCAGRFLPENKYLIEVHFLGLKSKHNNILLYLHLAVLVGILYRLFFFKKKPIKTQELISEKITHLGIFQFFPAQNKLVKKAIEINLSKKECELLEIFVANTNKIIKREELTKKVWEDNGVFVGRSLDTYISKLRKILKEDQNIKLINIHGVGYKLEVTSK